MNIRKRIFALLVAVCMIAGMLPVSAFAAGCEHHPSHTAECGYVEAVAGAPCTHECGADCYTTVDSCEHGDNHDTTCGYIAATEETEEVPCGHTCGDTCKTQVLNCTHGDDHDEACGYQAAVEAVACNYVCDTCGASAINEDDEDGGEDTPVCTVDESCTFTGEHDENCPKANCGDEGGNDTLICTCGTETGEHSEGCALATSGSDDTPTPCTKDEKCTQPDGHDGDCIIPPACTGDMSCTLTEGHNEGCEKAAYDLALAECTRAADCGASVHHDDCAKGIADKLALCDSSEACSAELHKEGCLKAKADADAAELAKCDKSLTCPAALHHEDCEYAVELAKCTEAEGCEAAVHKDTCPKYVWTCDKTTDCKAADHEEDCPVAIKAAAQLAFDEMVAALPAPETVDPLDEEMVKALHEQIQAIITYALENGLYETQDKVTSHPVIAALLDAMQPKDLTLEMNGYTLDFSWYVGKESSESFEISTIGQLAAFAKITQGQVTLSDGSTIAQSSFSHKTVKLTADLTFADNQYWYNSTNGTNFIITNFDGTFDGNDKTISNIRFSSSSANNTLAFFDSIVSGGTVKNLIIDGVTANLSAVGTFSTIAGTIAGTASNCHVKNVAVTSTADLTAYGFGSFSGTSVATGCSVDGLNISATGKLKGGGFGSFAGTSISGCSVENVTASSGGEMNPFSGFGDITSGTCQNNTVKTLKLSSTTKVQNCSGFGYTEAAATVSNCHVEDFEAKSDTQLYRVGGFTAHSYGNLTDCTVKDVTFTSPTGAELGGFAGDAEATAATDSCEYSNCTATNVTITLNSSSSSTGGFIGQTKGSGTLTVTNCHVTGLNMTLTGSLTSHTCAGFVAEAKTPISTYTNCSVSGTIDATGVTSTNYPIGGFAGNLGWSGGSTSTFTSCEANVNITSNGPAGGFIGQVKPRGASTSSNATFIGCEAKGSVASSSIAGGFAAIADSGKFEDCTVSGTVSGATATGGFLGEARPDEDSDENITLNSCQVSGSVAGNSGVAGGLVGYIKADTTVTFDEGCSHATNVSGAITSEVANAPDKEYSISSDGTISYENTNPVCYGDFGGYDIGFNSVQAAVDAGVTNITLLQNVSDGFILNGVDHDSVEESGKEFVLNLNEYTFNGTIQIYHTIKSFTANGTAEGSSILLSMPLGEHNVFNGWCSGTGTAGATAEYAQKSEDGLHWIIEPGKTYHTHFTPTGYTEIPAAQRHLVFDAMVYGSTVSNPLSITFTYTGDDGNPAIKGFEPNPYFTVSGIGSLTATIRPNENLSAGTYSERIYVIMHDGSSHEIWANVIVGKVDSQVEPVPDPDTEAPTVINATYGDTITLAVQVSRAQTRARITAPAQNQVAFYCGENELGVATVTYGSYEGETFVPDSTCTTGIATLEYDTKLGGIPVGENTITVEYGGSINLLGSNGTITVVLAAKELTVTGLTAADREYDGSTNVTVSGGTLVGVESVDEVADDVVIDSITASLANGDVGENKPVIISITLSGEDSKWYTVKNPANITMTITAKNIAAESTETVNGIVVTGPATVDQNGATVTENGKVEVDDEEFTVTTGTVTVKSDGTVEIPANTTVTTEDDVVITGPATINSDGSVSVGNGGTVTNGDTTVEVTDGDVSVDEDGTVEIPAGSTVTVGDTTITGPATVDEDGNISIGTGGTITNGDNTVTVTTGPVNVKDDGTLEVPSGSTVIVDGVTITGPATVNPDGSATVATGGKVNIDETEYTVTTGPVTVDDGEITIPQGSVVTDSTNTIAGPTTVGGTTDGQTFPEGSNLTVGDTSITVTDGSVTEKEDGSVEIPAGSTATVNGQTITGPASVDADGDVTIGTGGTVTNGDTTVTVTTGPVNVADDGTVEIPAGSSVIVDGQTITGPASVDSDGNITIGTGGTISSGDTTVTGPATVNEDGSVSVGTGGKIEIGDDEYIVTSGPVNVDDGEITIPEGSSVNDGKNIIAGPTTIDPDDTTQEFPEGSDVTVGDTTVEVTDGKITENEDGSIEIPEDTTVTVGDATITGPATVDPDGDITVNEGGSVTVGDSTVTVTDGSVTVDEDGTVTVPTGSTVIVNGETITGPAVVDKNGVEVFYKITSGASLTVTKGYSATFISNAPFGKFVEVLVDGRTVAASNYTVVSGSTKVTLKASYINTLTVGEHTLTIVSTDGSASTIFTVKNANSNVPATGDDEMPVLWITLFAVSAFGAIAALMPKRRKGKYQR